MSFRRSAESGACSTSSLMKALEVLERSLPLKPLRLIIWNPLLLFVLLLLLIIILLLSCIIYLFVICFPYNSL